VSRGEPRDPVDRRADVLVSGSTRGGFYAAAALSAEVGAAVRDLDDAALRQRLLEMGQVLDLDG
jgi:hypothetical protein